MRANYANILLCFWKNSLIREMTFRGHFLINVVSELLWIVMLLVYVGVIFRNTPDVRGWTEHQYLFLMGTHMLITALFEAVFYGNCWRVGQMVRSGDLDFVLVRPAGTQFLLSLERLDYSPLANVPIAVGLLLYSLNRGGVAVDAGQILLFAALVAGGVLLLYAMLFMFAITSVWLIRQTGVDHLWFYTVSLARYPAEMYRRFLGGSLYFVLVFVIPVLLVCNLPANVMVRHFEPVMVGYLFGAAVVMLVLSNAVMRLALRWYRSASS